MYIYLIYDKANENYLPVLAPKMVEGKQKLQPVAGYYLHRLQRFVKGQSNLPQDGYYESISKNEFDEYCELLDFCVDSLDIYESVSNLAASAARFVLDEEERRVVLEFEDGKEDWSCYYDGYNDDDDDDSDDDDYPGKLRLCKFWISY